MIVAAALILVDEGRLSPDDRVQRHLPDFRLGDPRMASELTLRDLLTHRSGLPGTDFLVFNQGMSLDLQLPYLERVLPAAPPRSAFIYQNTGYQLGRGCSSGWHASPGPYCSRRAFGVPWAWTAPCEAGSDPRCLAPGLAPR